MCETEDAEEEQVHSRDFMSARACCAEALFVKQTQEWAKQKNAEAPEEVLRSPEVKQTMEWCGNSPPIMCISATETDHAQFVNSLNSKGHARAKTNTTKHKKMKHQQQGSRARAKNKHNKTQQQHEINKNGFFRTAALPIVQDTQMVRGRHGHDARLLVDIDKVVARSKVVLTNQCGDKQHRRNNMGLPAI